MSCDAPMLMLTEFQWLAALPFEIFSCNCFLFENGFFRINDPLHIDLFGNSLRRVDFSICSTDPKILANI